jgi:hypothetical protein
LLLPILPDEPATVVASDSSRRAAMVVASDSSRRAAMVVASEN